MYVSKSAFTCTCYLLLLINRVSAQSEATLGETNLGSDNVEVTKMDRVPPERAELSGKDDGTNCSDRNTNL
jgi:hypothetical protein